MNFAFLRLCVFAVLNMNKPKRILIYNVNWIGDVLLSTAAIKGLRRAYPGAYLACVIPERCREILEGNHNLDEVIVFDERDKKTGISGFIEFIRLLRRRKFDTCLLLHRSMTRALIAFLSGITDRVGYDYRKHNFLLTRVVSFPDPSAVHRLEYYLALAGAIGADVSDKRPELYIGESDIAFARRLLADNGVLEKEPAVALNAGGNWGPKRWPPENFALLADKLVSELGVKVVITGSIGDKRLAGTIAGKMKSQAINIAGKTDLKQLAAVFKQSRVVVSADSAPMHIACAVGAPLVCLLGPTAARITGPYPEENAVILRKDIGCEIPCYNVQCDDNRCMRAISVDEVFDVLKEMVSGGDQGIGRSGNREILRGD